MKLYRKKFSFTLITVSFLLFFSMDVLCQETKQSSYSGETLRLEDLERMALQDNPTLLQAAADVRSAEGLKFQAGLYPNPRLGYDGEEISTRDPSERGIHSFFIEQRIVTAGKLRYGQDIFAKEQAKAVAEQEAQKRRIINDVRIAYYHTLGAEKIVELRRELSKIARQAVDVSGQLYNIGQADRPDVLEAEVEAQKAEIDLRSAKGQLDLAWHVLMTVVGKPDLRRTPLAGDLEFEIPRFDQKTIGERLLRDSPQIKIVQARVERAEAVLHRAKAERYPDITVRAGYMFYKEPEKKESQFLVGLSIPLPIFNLNQGNIASALAELSRGREEIRRLELILLGRMASAYNAYVTSAHAVEQYRKSILSRAQEAYDLYLKRFKQMAASYPQVLIAQRNLFQIRVEYVQNLVSLWESITRIQGLLLTGSLDAPRMN